MKYTSLFFCCFFIFTLNAQIQIDTTKYWDGSNIGSLKKITDGKVLRLAVFVSEPDNNWSIKEKKQMLKKETKAFSWIKKQTLKYDVTFEIDQRTFFLEKDL